MTTLIARVPATVFSGFLGSGKTTVIMNLVEVLIEQNIKVVYIKNEIGNEGVDGQLVRGQHIQTKELLNGCICCTLVGPFIQAIDEVLVTYQPDRLLIEASGAADPAAIALMIDRHPKLTRDGVLAIIDVVNFAGYKDLSLTARNQTVFTDLIVFNKIELVDLDQKRRVVEYVRELNTQAPIVEAPNGVLNPHLVFGIATQHLHELLGEFASAAPQSGSSTEPSQHAHQHHLTDDGIESQTVTFQLPPSRDELERYVKQLPSSVIRVKGVVLTRDQGLQLVNKVGARVTLEPAAAELTKETKLVLIGFHIAELNLGPVGQVR